MNNGGVAHIRTPNDEELKRIRDLWSALKQKRLPTSTDIGLELQTYLSHAVMLVGVISGLHPITCEPVKAGPFPLRVTEDGVARVHYAVQLWSAILSLWTTDTGSSETPYP